MAHVIIARPIVRSGRNPTVAYCSDGDCLRAAQFIVDDVSYCRRHAEKAALYEALNAGK